MSVKPMRYSRRSFITAGFPGSSGSGTMRAALNVGQKRFPGRAKLKPWTAVYTDGLMPIETMSRPGARRSGRLRGFELTADELQHVRVQARGERVERPRLRHRAQPGQLPLRQLPGCEDPAVAQVAFADLAVEELPRLAITDAAHRWHLPPQRPAPAQGAQLIDEAVREDGVEAGLDAPMQRRTIGGNQRYRN